MRLHHTRSEDGNSIHVHTESKGSDYVGFTLTFTSKDGIPYTYVHIHGKPQLHYLRLALDQDLLESEGIL